MLVYLYHYVFAVDCGSIVPFSHIATISTMRHSARRGSGAAMLVSVMTLRRLVLLTAVLFATGLLVSMRSLDSRTNIELERAQPRSFIRRGLDRFMKSVPVAPVSRREFFKQRTSQLSADQQQVVDMTKHAWKAYRDFANWRDFLNVYQQRGGSVYDHDMALTLVDSLDTLFILGMHEEFDEASAWVKANLETTMLQSGRVSFFEITIRSLGGLLSAYYLSGSLY